MRVTVPDLHLEVIGELDIADHHDTDSMLSKLGQRHARSSGSNPTGLCEGSTIAPLLRLRRGPP